MSNKRVKFVSRKISKVKWRPMHLSAFFTGTWDDEDNKISVWSYPSTHSTTKELSDVDPQLVTEISFLGGGVTDIKVTATGLVFAASSNGSLHVYKHTDEKLLKYFEWKRVHSYKLSTAQATGVATRGQEVVSIGEDGKICVFNYNKLEKIRQLESSDCCALTTISFLRHQEIVVGNVFGYLKTWDLRSNGDEPTHTLMMSGEQAGVMSVNAHPTQPHILATGHEEGTLCIWDLRQNSRPTTILDGHTAGITDILFHPANPDFLYTSSLDGSLLQWNSSALKSGTIDEQSRPTGNPWLNCEASKHRLDITSLSHTTACVNSMDLSGTTLVWGTDNEALYIIPDIFV